MANIDKFRQEVLEAHNKRRELHGAPPVKLSAELNTLSQNWAENLAKEGKFDHSPKDMRKGAGENIAAHTKLLTGDEVVQMWYSEIENYDYSKPVFGMNTNWRPVSLYGLASHGSGNSASDFVLLSANLFQRVLDVVTNQHIGHFTQVVWKSCEEIGVSVSSKPGVKGMYVYVANYKPAGNMKGDFDKNVLPKKK